MAINEIASQPSSSLLMIRYFTRSSRSSRSSRAQHALSERSTRGRMPGDAWLSPPNAKSSSVPSPGGELDTSETWSRICSHKLLLNLIVSNEDHLKADLTILLSLVEMYFNITETSKMHFQTEGVEQEYRNDVHNKESYRFDSTACNRSISFKWIFMQLGYYWPIRWMYWLNFDNSFFGHQSLVTSSGRPGLSAQPDNDFKKLFWVIFAFGCHLRFKIYNTNRFWFDVFFRIMNATEHSKFLEIKFWVCCWILEWPIWLTCVDISIK